MNLSHLPWPIVLNLSRLTRLSSGIPEARLTHILVDLPLPDGDVVNVYDVDSVEAGVPYLLDADRGIRVVEVAKLLDRCDLFLGTEPRRLREARGYLEYIVGRVASTNLLAYPL